MALRRRDFAREACGVSFLETFRADPPKHQVARFHIDLLAPETGFQPSLRHHAIKRIVAPPRPILMGGRKLGSDKALDLIECHWHFIALLRAKIVSKRVVLTHGIILLELKHMY